MYATRRAKTAVDSPTSLIDLVTSDHNETNETANIENVQEKWISLFLPVWSYCIGRNIRKSSAADKGSSRRGILKARNSVEENPTRCGKKSSSQSSVFRGNY